MTAAYDARHGRALPWWSRLTRRIGRDRRTALAAAASAAVRFVRQRWRDALADDPVPAYHVTPLVPVTEPAPDPDVILSRPRVCGGAQIGMRDIAERTETIPAVRA